MKCKSSKEMNETDVSVSDDKTSTCNKGDALRSRPDENVVRKRKLFLSNVFMLYLCEAVIGSTCSD